MAQFTCPKCGKTYERAPERASEPLCSNCQKNASAESLARLAELSGKPIFTYAVIGANVAVYLLMLVSGASWIEPSIQDALRFGADFGPLTLTGQWWRLFTCMFVHFGIIHLALNMWCLWSLGILGERFMGRAAFAFLYFASGLAASLTSELWNPMRVSAGASGAVFGAAGGLVAFLYLKKAPIDLQYAKQRLKSLWVFIAYNLIYGLKAGVDNAAHVGGVIAGLALGAVIPSMLLDAVRDSAGTDVGSVAASNLPPPALGASSEAQTRFKLVAAATVVVLGLGAYATARYSIPKMRAVRNEMLNAFENDTSELIPVLQGRIQKNPQDSAGLALLGEEYLFADDPRSAVAPFQKALALDPRSASTHHNLAIADLGVGDFQGAESEIIKAAGQDDPGAHELIQGLAEDGLGHPDAALDHFKKVVPSPSATYVDMLDLAQAHANLELGRAEDARAIYAKMLARRATDTRALAGMAALKSAANTPAGKLDPPPVPIIFNRLMDLPETWPYLP